MTYSPKPIDVSQVALTQDILDLTEQLARNGHDIWAQKRLAEGWRVGPQRDEQRKQHPCLVAYEGLPESEKQYDRHMALATLQAIVALGYRIEKNP